ncbi:MAG: DUF5654 family protein [Candidatus Marsarchaeota archaeon]|nr:DUF5654 family protein [Candidatus Marsarchaeota archaeon]
MTLAFGLIAALAWNNAITPLFTKLFGTPNDLPPDLTYAIIVTIIAVIVTLWISKATRPSQRARRTRTWSNN